MDPGLTAALAAGIAQYVSYLVPLSAAGRIMAAMAVILSLALVNAFGLRAGARARLTVLKLVLLAAIVVLGFASGGGQWSHFVPFVEPARIRHAPGRPGRRHRGRGCVLR